MVGRRRLPVLDEGEAPSGHEPPSDVMGRSRRHPRCLAPPGTRAGATELVVELDVTAIVSVSKNSARQCRAHELDRVGRPRGKMYRTDLDRELGQTAADRERFDQLELVAVVV